MLKLLKYSILKFMLNYGLYLSNIEKVWGDWDVQFIEC
jgi:hypothetical protein